MGALGYLYRKKTKNKIRKALHKPITYFYMALALLYMFVIPFSLGTMASDFGMASPMGMAAILTLIAFFILPGNLIAYAKRKGLLFQNCDVHFMFPSPLSPKKILAYTYMKSLAGKAIMVIIAIICGSIVFHVTIWRVLIYAIFSLVIENILEGCAVLLIYGSEKIEEKHQNILIAASYGLVACLGIIGIIYYIRYGLGTEMVTGFLTGEEVRMVPVIGWYICVIQLLFVGYSTLNMIGTLLYLGLWVLLLVLAIRMECRGGYYEDAIKFSDDYEEVVQSRKQGDMNKRLGKKTKFGKASIRWKGVGAKALFYRQLLEYKKNRFFIFDATTLFSLAAGIGIAVLYVKEGGFHGYDDYVIPAVSAYFIFIFSSMSGKWGKEIKSPYTYLIPDNAFRKLWNATAMQIVQSVVNALLITVPGAVVMQLEPMVVILTIIGYVALSANKLYALAVAEIVTGNVLGTVGKQLFQLLIQGVVIGIAVLGMVLGAYVGGLQLAYTLMDVFLVLATLVFMVVATLNFYRMES